MKNQPRLVHFLLAIATIAGVFLSLALPIQASDHSGQSTEEFHQTYPLTSGGRVELDNINGDVRISSWDRDEVRVDAVKYAGSKERLEEAQIKVDAGTGYVSIHTEYRHHDLTFNAFARNNPPSVEYTLTVPRSSRLDEIKLVNGSLNLENVGGEVRASSVNGSVKAHGLAGRAKLSTVNSRIEAEFTHLSGSPIELSSVNGSVDVTLPSDASAQIEASAVSGHIDNDFGLHTSNHQWVGHDLRGQVGGGEARIKLSNVNGRIEIHHANDGKTLSPVKDLRHDDKDEDDDEI